MKKMLDYLRSIRLPSFDGIAARARGLRPRQILVGVGTALAAIAVFAAVRGFTTCWHLTTLPGLPPASCGINGSGASSTFSASADGILIGPPPTPDVGAPEVSYPKWDGGSRINIAFFGLRGGETAGEDCPKCTDTIIVFTVDPIARSAGMISVPRDMYVNIPGGFGYSRINTAWTSGEGARLPGGGPGLAMQTVSQFLGVPINYYVQVDFDTFVQIIHLIGGVDIYIDEDLVLDRVGPGNDKLVLKCCGLRHLGGVGALAYARGRHTSEGDVDRSKRQQKLILAIRDKIFSPENFPHLMATAPQLYNTFSSGIHTNMSLEDALKLAALVSEIPVDKIKRVLIDDHDVNFGNVTLGGKNAAILMPIPDKIREKKDEIFTIGGPTSPIAQGDPRALMQADGARVEVTNNTYTANLDSRTGNFLVAQGMQVTALGQPTGVSDQTVVVIYAPKLYTLRYLIQPLGMVTGSNQIYFRPDPSQPVDIEIRLGNDWVSKLPPGY